MKTMVTFENYRKQLRQAIDASEISDNYQVTEQIVTKNGNDLHGIIFRTPGNLIAPVFYFEDFYKSEKTADEALESIKDFLANMSGKKQPDLQWIRDWDVTKDRIVPKLVNGNNVGEGIPSIPFEDMMITFVIKVSEVETIGRGSITVDYPLLEIWGVSKEELQAVAMDNLVKEEFHTVSLFETVGFGEDPEDMPKVFIVNSGLPQEAFGARALLRYNNLKQFAVNQKTDFWVLPVSTEEILLIDAATPKESARMMLTSIFGDPSIPKLSHTLFRVCRDGDTLKVIDDEVAVAM